ncbi:MAG: DMT family transporter [Sandaracinaceae bacterium]|nr:DMT family transporter [Sandaracinaceae bacterium]
MVRSPLVSGALLALLAALAFGVTTPIVAWAGRGIGPLTTAALLYAGAAVSALALARLERAGPTLGRPQRARLVVIAIVGAGIAPTLLAWGLQRIGATSGALLLNLEAVFTVGLAWAIHREPIGARVLTALGLMALGGVTLTYEGARDAWSMLGVLAVTGATFAWALDNTLTRALADHDPVRVVAGKAGLGAAITTTCALVSGEPLPRVIAVLCLLACGATGYGLSLSLYLLAQRRIGAARTGSLFALAPFVGAAIGWAAGERASGWTLASGVLFAVGVGLHVTERHTHPHQHPALTHEHAHRHDDGHHGHVHDPPVVGEHTHPHDHDVLEHDHEHAPDLHHDHAH